MEGAWFRSKPNAEGDRLKKKVKQKGREPESPPETMKRNELSNQWYCVLILFILPIAYFFPYLIDPGKMLFGTDWIPTGGYARFYWQRSFFLEELTVSKWMPYIFSGFSTVTSYSDTFFYPLNLITTILPTNLQRVILFALNAGVAGTGLFFLLRRLKCGIYSAFFAGVVYEFSGVILTTTYAGHLGRGVSAALLPVSFYFLLRALDRRSIPAFLLFGGFAGLHLLGGHFQMSYLALVSLCFSMLYYLFVHLKEGWGQRLRVVVLFALSVVFASALTAVKYLPPYLGLEEGARGFERGYEYATSWSLPVGEVFDLLIPNFSGILDGYWGLNYFKLSNEYFGVLALILAVATIVVMWRERWVKFFTFYTILFFLFAFGGNTPFYHLPYQVIPLLEKFRAPAIFVFMTTFGLVALAGMGLGSIVSKETEGRRAGRVIGVITALILIFALGLTFFGDGIVNWIGGSIGETLEAAYGHSEKVIRLGRLRGNLPAMTSRMWIAFLISSTLYAGISLYGRGKVSKRQLVFFLLVITLVDQWSLDRQYLKSSPSHDRYFAGDDAVTFLRGDPDVFRVFPVRYRHEMDGLLLLNDIETIGGYGANPPRRYQQFIGAGESVMFSPMNLYQDRGLLDLLNVKYIIIPNLPEDLSHLSPKEKGVVKGYLDYLSGYEKVFTGSNSVYLNSGYLPRAYIVHDFQVAGKTVDTTMTSTDPRRKGEEALEMVLSPDFDHHRSVILEKEPGFVPTGEPDRFKEATIVERNPHRLVCEVDLERPGILVVTENYHPDWKVSVDGDEKELLRANFVLKGVELPAGSHRVEFVYRSNAFRLGATFTLLSYVLFAYLIYGWRKKGY
jgi:hypothetical protein